MYSSIPSSGTALANAVQVNGQDLAEDAPLLKGDLGKPAKDCLAEGLGARWKLAASSAGFLADAYDLFTIDLVLLILGLKYGEAVINIETKSLMVGSMLAGIIIGQLSFGFVADWVGRKWAFVTTAGLTVLGALFSAAVWQTTGPFGIPQQLALARFVLGLGVGGEYPLSATVTAEGAQDPQQRGSSLAIVISMQGWGMLLSSVIALVLVPLNVRLEVVWRLLLAFGALPSMVAFYLRWQLHESPTFNEAHRAESKDGSGRSVSCREHLLVALQRIGRCWPVLLGTSSTWMLMNSSLYSLGSFKSQVLSAILDSVDQSARLQVFNAALFAGLTSVFAIAGFMAAILLINRIGRFLMQLQGFIALAVIFLVLAVLSAHSNDLPAWVVVLLMGMSFFFQNCGPNTTTYIVPAEAFPTLVRATCHGISAASGKVGALIGTMAFPATEAAFGMYVVYGACCLTALLGAVATYLFTPRCYKTLQQLDDEPEGEQRPAAA